MAFLHPIEVAQTGITASYWRITHLALDRGAGIAEVVLHGFLDEAARRAGKNSLDRMTFRLPTEALRSSEALALDDIYRAIRETPEGEDQPPVFENARDH